MSENTVRITSGYVPDGYVSLGIAAFKIRNDRYGDQWRQEIERGGPESFPIETPDGPPLQAVLPTSLEDAFYDLRQWLASGQLTGYAISDEGPLSPILLQYWAGRRADVHFEKWADFNTSHPLPTIQGLVQGRVLVSVGDLTALLTGDQGPIGPQALRLTAHQSRSSAQRAKPQRERAKQRLKQLYPNGVPPQSAVSNMALEKAVNEGLPAKDQLKRDSILRAAGRKR